MESILRAAVTYIILFILFRISGKRTLAKATHFDFILLLIVSEAVQEALIDGDRSLTNSFLVIFTLVAIDIGLSIAKHKSKKIERIIDGVPVLLVEHGTPIQESMDKSRIDRDDILEAARETQGLKRMDQIKYAVLEKNGKISIIPMEDAK